MRCSPTRRNFLFVKQKNNYFWIKIFELKLNLPLDIGLREESTWRQNFKALRMIRQVKVLNVG